MIREVMSGLLILTLLAGSLPVLNDIRAEICGAVTTPDHLGRELTPLENFVAANRGANFGELCE